MNLIGNITVDAWGRTFKCQLDLTKYTDGNPAIMVYEGGEPFGKLTINVPEYAHALGPHEFFVKDWSENVPICRACVESGLFIETTREHRVSRFCTAKVWRLSDKAIANLEA